MEEVNKIKEVNIEGEVINVKRDFLGWRIVHPYKNKDGTYNMLNLIIGGWRNLITLLFLFALVGVFMYAYHHDVNAIEDNYKNISADPISFCKYK